MKLMAILLCVLVIGVVGCVPAEKKCSADSECVPKTCCHAKDAVNKANGPKCTGSMCTAECVSGSVDCGQGKVACVSGECKVVLKK